MTMRRPNRQVGGFGYFGKGAMAPPPGPPPGAAIFTAGQWLCEGAKPANDATSFWQCCPSGWTKVAYGDVAPCKGPDKDLNICGPLPEGATAENAVCCPNIKQWLPIVEGADACREAELASGKAVPGRSETMLAPDIEISPEPILSPKMLLIGGIAAALLIVATVIASKR